MSSSSVFASFLIQQDVQFCKYGMQGLWGQQRLSTCEIINKVEITFPVLRLKGGAVLRFLQCFPFLRQLVLAVVGICC